MTKSAAGSLSADLSAAGFLVLGEFACAGHSTVPICADDQPAQTLLLIGSTGPSIWPRFTASPEFKDGIRDPLDRYTKRILTGIAALHGLSPLFPWEGPPYHPFQQWAQNCGGFSPSPMGVLAHVDYGPWTGFRAAFLGPTALEVPRQGRQPGPCETCTGKPCLTACPVSALDIETGYDVPKCRTYVAGKEDASCRTGCLARRACPFGPEHSQIAETGKFHMRSFLGLSGT